MQGWLCQVECSTAIRFGCDLQAEALEMLASAYRTVFSSVCSCAQGHVVSMKLYLCRIINRISVLRVSKARNSEAEISFTGFYYYYYLKYTGVFTTLEGTETRQESAGRRSSEHPRTRTYGHKDTRT